MNALVIDTSALLAIYFREPTADWIHQQIAQASRLVMSTVNLAETLLRFRDTRPTEADTLETRLLASNIEWIMPDTAQAVLVAKARLLYPARLCGKRGSTTRVDSSAGKMCQAGRNA